MSNEATKPQIKPVEISGKKYQIPPITGRRATLLDRKAMDILIGMCGKGSTKNEMVAYFCRAFASMDDADFDKIITESISGIVFCGGDTEKSFTFDSENVWEYFRGHIDDLYSLIIEAWEAYELTPFVKAQTGAETKATP